MGGARRTVGIVLAGGDGTRMGSAVPKPLVPLHGRPLVGHVVAALGAVAGEVVVVAGPHPGWAAYEPPAGTRLVTQDEATGNGDALRIGLAAVAAGPADAGPTDVVVALADTPLLRSPTFAAVLAASRPSALAVLTATRPGAGGYGPIVRDGDGRVIAVGEPTDAGGPGADEVNASVYAAGHAVLSALVAALPPGRRGAECLVTGLVPAACRAGVEVRAVACEPAGDAAGVNTPAELAAAGAALSRRASAGGTPSASPARRPRTPTRRTARRAPAPRPGGPTPGR